MTAHNQVISPRICRQVVSMLMLLVTVLVAGCSNRMWYRQRADQDAYCIINQKTQPQWPLEGFTIDVGGGSRMFDPNSIDCPPMPPDDPTAHELMHCVYCMKGYPCWHANGNTSDVENPDWPAYLPLNEQGEMVVDANASVLLALQHAPDYQEAREDLYLSALDVSFERFRFDTQFFGGSSLFFAANGRNRNALGGDSSSLLNLATFSPGRNLQMRRLFASGGELVVGLANSLMWEFSGPNTNSVNTLLDFTLVQPLLRGAGRDIALERLTVAERSLLANVRQMERFRRGFYLETVTGRDAGDGPSRRGGLFGGAGLEGFSGVGSGGFGRVGGSGNFGGGGGFDGGAGAGQAGGYLGLVQAKQDIVNQRGNIAALQSSVVQLEAYFMAGRIDYFQVELARQALFNAQSRLLNTEQDFATAVDQFKISLGLPPYIDMQIDDQLIQPFQLVDTSILPLQNRLTVLQQQVGRLLIAMLSENVEEEDETDNPPSQITWNDSTAHTLTKIRSLLGEARNICEEVASQQLPRARQDVDQLTASLDDRLSQIEKLRQRFRKRLDVTSSTGSLLSETNNGSSDEPLPFDPVELKNLPDVLTATLDDLDARFNAALGELEKLTGEIEEIGRQIQTGSAGNSRHDAGQQQDDLAKRLRNLVYVEGPDQLTNLSANVLSLTLVQARARTEGVGLVETSIDWSSALDVARANRRDWMNARAALVDSWRLIRFNADALESQLDIVLEGDISNIGDNPLAFRDSTGRLRVGVQFDAPISRLGQRNTYRQALVEYQQARRNFYRFEDRIAFIMRSTTRNMEVNQLNFELRRAAVKVAIAQVELARLRLQEPPKPNEEATLGATTARDLVSALTDLLTVQNDFLSVWINHEVLRRVLDFEMGTMQLDPAGLWIDPGPLVADEPVELDRDAAVESDEGLPIVPPNGLPQGISIDLPSAPIQREQLTLPSAIPPSGGLPPEDGLYDADVFRGDPASLIPVVTPPAGHQIAPASFEEGTPVVSPLQLGPEKLDLQRLPPTNR